MCVYLTLCNVSVGLIKTHWCGGTPVLSGKMGCGPQGQEARGRKRGRGRQKGHNVSYSETLLSTSAPKDF